MKKETVFRYIILSLMAIATSFALIARIDLKHIIVFKSNANMIAFALVAILLFREYQKYYIKDNKNSKLFIFLSLLFSLFITIGYSFNEINSWDLCFSKPIFIFFTIVKIFGFSSLFNLVLHKLEAFVIGNKKDIKLSTKLKKLFEEKPFKMSLIVMLICWLPYIISFFPGILSPDPAFQIKQFFGFETKYMDFAVGASDASTITGHHPVVHTALLGGCVKLGHILFDSTNIGVFIYSIIQITILSCTLAYTIKYMKKLNTPYILRVITLLIYSLVPVFPHYALSTVKDVIFSSFVIIYMINLFDMIKYRTNKLSLKKAVFLAILMLLIMLFRNNGIYLVLMSFPFLFLVRKKSLVTMLIILAIPLIGYKSFNNIVLPYFKITEGSIREMLSIPFQQTARYVKYYGDELDDDEIKAIDKVLDIKTLAQRYDPNLADDVKSEYNPYTTDEELKEYFKMWFKGFKKRPGVYIEATLNNTYGYLTPNTNNWYIYYKYNKILNSGNDTFNYHYNGLAMPRHILSRYALAYPFIPVLGLIVNIGFCVWVYMYMFISLLKDKLYRYLVAITPMISLFLVCLASPANTYFRYAMPYVFALPIMIAIFLNIKKERSDKDE